MNKRIGIYILLFAGIVFLLATSCKKDDVPEDKRITDADGNVYTSVTIGTQTWLVENLKTTKYNNGTVIPNITDNLSWANLSTEAYCWYDNNPGNKNSYGALYNWFAINNGKLCPTGWHIPKKTEWETLCEYLGGRAVAGSKMKETGNTHWISPLTIATNSSGFTALPGGYRTGAGTPGEFSEMGYAGNWWTAEGSYTTSAWYVNIYYEDYPVGISGIDKAAGFSIRCLKD